jgi:hypothetical protein
MSASAALRTIDDQWYQYASSNSSELARSTTKPIAVARPQLSSPSVVHRSKWAKPTVDRLMALAPLRDNWDQRGSAGVRADVLSFAWQLLAQILPEDGMPPIIIPLGNGGIQLEWSSENAELEIEISRPFQMSASLTEITDDGELEIGMPTDTWDSLTEAVREHFRS